MRFDFGVRHPGQELHLPGHPHPADMAGAARQEDAIPRTRAAEARHDRFALLELDDGAQPGIRDCDPGRARRQARRPVAGQTDWNVEGRVQDLSYLRTS